MTPAELEAIHNAARKMGEVLRKCNERIRQIKWGKENA